MDDYPAGSVKRDPDSGYLAQRTALDEPERAWWVFRYDGPPHMVAHADIEAWTDYVPREG